MTTAIKTSRKAGKLIPTDKSKSFPKSISLKKSGVNAAIQVAPGQAIPNVRTAKNPSFAAGIFSKSLSMKRA